MDLYDDVTLRRIKRGVLIVTTALIVGCGLGKLAAMVV